MGTMRLALLVLAVLPAISQPAHYLHVSPRSDGNPAHHHDDKQRILTVLHTPIADANASESNGQAQPADTQPPNTAKVTDWIIAVATIAYVGVSTFLWCTVKKQARIAKRAAEAAIAAECAWLRIDITYIAGFRKGLVHASGRLPQGTTYEWTSGQFTMRCVNIGRTPAWIGEKRATLQILDTLPPRPDLGLCEVQDERGEIIDGRSSGESKDVTLESKRANEMGKFPVVYGYVAFRDAFDRNRRAIFGYAVRADGALERLSQPEWNNNVAE